MPGARDYLADLFDADITPDIPDERLASAVPPMPAADMSLGGANPPSPTLGETPPMDMDAMNTPPPVSPGGAPIRSVEYDDGSVWEPPGGSSQQGPPAPMI